MADPIKSYPLKITGTTEGDKITILVTSSDGLTQRGRETLTLDSTLKAELNLANFAPTYEAGDLIIASENGKTIGGINYTVGTSGGTTVTITGTTVAFPSRSL